MASVTGMTAAEIEALLGPLILSGTVDPVSRHLLLTTVGGGVIDVGNVKGDPGDPGAPGAPGAPGPTGPPGTAALNFFYPEDYGAVGNGSTVDYAAIVAADAAAAAAGGGIVFYKNKTYSIGTNTLNLPNINVIHMGSGRASTIKYTGTGDAVVVGSKTVAGPISSFSIERLRILGTATAGKGLTLIGVQFCLFRSVRVEGPFTLPVCYDTKSVSPYDASINNTWIGGYITGGVNGLKLTKDAADPGSDGSNHNTFFGLKVAAFTGTGIDVDAGENNSFFGCDSSTGSSNTVGIRINDDVCTFISCRADNSSAGVGAATADGYRITANGRDHVIINPTGNGPILSRRIVFEDPSVPGIILRQGFNQIIGDQLRSRQPTGQDFAFTRAWKNVSTSTIAASEVAYFDSTCGEGECKRAPSGSQPNPKVNTVSAPASGGIAYLAEKGSIATVNCDTGAVNIGDTLVTSTAAGVNARAMANNAVVDPRYIIGTARTSKTAGANGTVKVLI